MLWTAVTISIVLGFLLVILFAWAACLNLGLNWARAENVTKTKLATATLLIFFVSLAFEVLFTFVLPVSDSNELMIGIVELVIGISVPVVAISLTFGIGLGKAIKAWIPTLIVTILSIPLALFVFRRYFIESFIVPTGAMSPTIVGKHWTDVCPDCGQPCYCTANDKFEIYPGETRLMICDNFHVSQFPVNMNWESREGDRFMVMKFLAPKRWDLITFRSPSNLDEIHVTRLVGLPGETIHIEYGAVWANGSRLELPNFLTGLEYSNAPQEWQGPTWGTKDNPAILGDDEYFVLGDFSLSSLDSRLWEQGATGHHAYAVPESSILGVVKHIFWPLDRLRTFR